MEPRITDLEVRLTYQELTLEELNEVIVKQQAQIDVLQSQVEHLLAQLQAQNDQIATPTTDERPPHY